jgi:ABC-type nitrate/sulfonate/bicarbonate transport system substrate-binding protein
MSRIDRRTLLASGAALLAMPHVARAQTVTIKMGALKLIHSIAPHFYERFAPAGTKIEVIPFESPTECKNGVVTQSVDFGVFGIAAGILGAAAKEPVTIIGSCCNKGPSASPSAKCTWRSLAATSRPTSAPSQAPACRSRAASASSSSIPIPRPWAA